MIHGPYNIKKNARLFPVKSNPRPPPPEIQSTHVKLSGVTHTCQFSTCASGDKILYFSSTVLLIASNVSLYSG